MKLKDKIKKLIKEKAVYGFLALNIIGFTVGPIENIRVQNKLDRTRYIAKGCNSIGTAYYGYDDNLDGKIDRIEETGILPSSRTLPIPVRRTHYEGDSNFDLYLTQIKYFPKTDFTSQFQ